MSLTTSFAFLVALTTASAPGDFALRDGDTVVFLGDSITAARTYGKIIENYTLLRFPDRKIRFYNAGWGGDTAAGGLARLQRDVLVHKPTVLLVAYGTNDIGWGVWADEPHKKKYLNSIRGIVEACNQRKIRVYICSAAVTAQDPEKSESSFLQKMCDEGMALSRELGGNAIDVQRAMRTIQKRVVAYSEKSKEKVTMHAADGAHLTDLGQLAMAFAILKGLHAPAEVSSAHIDATSGKVIAASACKISAIEVGKDTLSFTRLDEGLPFNNGLFYPLNYRFVPVHQELNRYMLRITGLPKGRYEVQADGRGAGTFTASQLAGGVNIASTTASAWLPGGPWDAQAHSLKSLTEARHELGIAAMLARAHLKDSPLLDQIAPGVARTDDEIIQLQRLTARPRPYRFTIQPARADKK